jgi:hypothetical protein
MTKLPHYEALRAEARRVRWPERFETDLTVHDRAALATRDPALPFAWVLNRGATYLAHPSAMPVDGAGHYAQDMPAICARAFGAQDGRWYWWDRRTLHDVETPERLAHCLRNAALGKRCAPHDMEVHEVTYP